MDSLLDGFLSRNMVTSAKNLMTLGQKYGVEPSAKGVGYAIYSNYRGMGCVVHKGMLLQLQTILPLLKPEMKKELAHWIEKTEKELKDRIKVEKNMSSSLMGCNGEGIKDSESIYSILNNYAASNTAN